MRSVVLHRNWSASLCLVVVGAPGFVFLWFSFSPPPVLREDQGGGIDGDLMVQLCNLLEARYQNTLQLWSWDLAVAWGPGPLSSNEITDLLLPLLLQLLWFTEICCGNGLPNSLASCRRNCGVYGQALGAGLGDSEQVRVWVWALPASFHPNRAYSPSSKGTQTLPPSLIILCSSEVRRSVLCWNKAGPSKQSCCDAWAQGSAAAKSHMEE